MNTAYVPYPFIKASYEAYDGADVAETWRPGTRAEMVSPHHSENVADGIGTMVLEMISRHKPPGFPERVFFVRTWIDPDGKAFGARKLRMTTAGAFKRLMRGHRHRFFDRDGNEWDQPGPQPPLPQH